MSNLLLVSATPFEIQPTLDFLETYKVPGTNTFVLGQTKVEVCITGVGMVHTALELARVEYKSYDMAINAGLAGSFAQLSPGEVVRIEQDCFSELGAEDDDTFLSIDQLQLGEQEVVIKKPMIARAIEDLKKQRGITVNTVHGKISSIEKVKLWYAPDVESMEGAAFIHAANVFGWEALQLRAISNKVEKRDRDKWDLPLAIKNLNNVLINILVEFKAKNRDKY